MAPKKLIKQGKVVIILRGRYAGRKAVVVKAFDSGTGERKFGHCIVAGLAAGPKRVTRAMDAKKIRSKTHMKPFVRFVNFNHILPTRYQVEFEVNSLPRAEGEDPVPVDEVQLKEPEQRQAVLKAFKTQFEKQYAEFDAQKEGKGRVGAQFLYSKLRF